jgi:hypothetical protein
MWSRLSTLQNTMYDDGFVDKSYVKLSTRRIFTAMFLHILQSLFITILWITTKNSWSIFLNFPFTVLESAWFINEIRKGWRELDEQFWKNNQLSPSHLETSRVEQLFVQPNVNIKGMTDTVGQLIEDLGDELQPFQLEDLSFLGREI